MKYRTKGTIDAVAWSGSNAAELAALAALAKHGSIRFASGSVYVDGPEPQPHSTTQKALNIGDFVLVHKRQDLYDAFERVRSALRACLVTAQGALTGRAGERRNAACGKSEMIAVEAIGEVAHEANRAYCRALGDF